MEKSFIEAQEQLLAQFEKGNNIVLSTSADNVVTSRTVSVIPFENALYITSIKRPGAMKIEQIEKNPNIAMCSNTMQITGKASITGFVTDEVNAKVAELYKEKMPESFARFASVPTAVFIKFDISTYKNWKMVDGRVEVTSIDFENQTVSKNIV